MGRGVGQAYSVTNSANARTAEPHYTHTHTQTHTHTHTHRHQQRKRAHCRHTLQTHTHTHTHTHTRHTTRITRTLAVQASFCSMWNRKCDNWSTSSPALTQQAREMQGLEAAVVRGQKREMYLLVHRLLCHGRSRHWISGLL
jgi:hypothetical protein